MKKTDLLSALGKINNEYLNIALDRAESSEESFENETNAKVGMMDSKNYIRQKLQTVIAVAASVLLCVGFLTVMTVRNNSLKNDENNTSNRASISLEATTAATTVATTTTITDTTTTTAAPETTATTTTTTLLIAQESDIEPYLSEDGKTLYFGVNAINYVDPDSDFLLEAVIYDNDNPEEPIELFSRSVLEVDVPNDVEATLLIDLDYDACPENILIECQFSAYYTGDYNDEPSTKWGFSYRHNKSEAVE